VNWPVVLIDFVVESFLKLSLTVPALGGVLMVAAIAGSDLRTVVGDEFASTADLVFGALATAPVALGAFLAAFAVAGLGGGVIMFTAKIGTLAILVSSDRAAGPVEDGPLDVTAVRRASTYSLV
jgi:hypothetical protein